MIWKQVPSYPFLQVSEMKRDIMFGISRKNLVAKYKTTVNIVKQITAGKTWKGIK